MTQEIYLVIGWHYFQGEKGSMGPPGPSGYPGEPVCIKQFGAKSRPHVSL